ncbi:MAG: phosphoethanolamine transferase [Verrucomicrobiaceae bacterium]|nr:phosphoethanolamine transferase [Verrucomicrobiaceae bacterium]
MCTPISGNALLIFVYGIALILLPHSLGAPLRGSLLVWLPTVLLVPAAALYYGFTAYPVNAWALLVLTETNADELASFAFPCLVILVISPVVTWLASHIFRRRIPAGASLPSLVRLIVCLTVFLFPAIEFAKLGLGFGWMPSLARGEKMFPEGLLIGAIKATELRNKLVDRSGVQKETNASPPPKASERRDVHVLVIGETCRYQNWSLHGYARETSPKLAATPGLLDFTNVASGASYTAMSVPMILTGATPGNHAGAAGMPSVASYFRAAGYKVYWLSTPNKHGLGDTTCSRYAQDAHESKFLSGLVDATGFGSFRTVFDSAIIPEIHDILAKGEPHVLIVCHTMGSHSNYADRYPQDFARYPADPTACPIARLKPVLAAEDKEVLQNAYDNSIAFTDNVLAGVIHELAAIPNAASTFCFVPDHGENGADASMMAFAHGTNTEDVLHVPMFMWMSPEYEKVEPRKATLLRSRTTVALSSFQIIHTLTDLAGITANGLDRDQSLCSSTYNEGPRKVVSKNGVTILDYDEIITSEHKRGGWHPLNPRPAVAARQ